TRLVLVLSAAGGPALTGGAPDPDTGRHEAGARRPPLRPPLPRPPPGHLRPDRPVCRAGRVARLLPAVGVGPLLARPRALRRPGPAPAAPRELGPPLRPR